MCAETTDFINYISYGTFVPVIVAKHDNGLYEPEVVDYEFAPVEGDS